MESVVIATNTLSISGLLAPERIRVGLDVETREDAIDAVVNLLGGWPEVNDLEQLREDVFARERVMSTGVGRGLALPHARTTAASNTLLAFAVTKKPVDFGALDGDPVRLILLLVGPEKERVMHVRLLGRISRMMNEADFRSRLLDAESEEEVIDVFRKAEEAYG